VAVVLIGELGDEFKQVYRRQQDDLLAHVKVNVYFENQGQGNPDTGYYVNTASRVHIPIEFIQANDTYFWVQLHWRDNTWVTTQAEIIRDSPHFGWWNKTDPQHPDHIDPQYFSPMLHTTVEQEEEILVGGVHYIATLQRSHLFTEQAPILPQIIAAVEQGISIPLHTTPAAAVHPQLSINMAEQQEEINVTTGQTGQEMQRINVITNPANGALKGNPPIHI